MPSPVRIAAASALACAAAAAPDMLPLKHGIFVPVGTACRGASNADMVNYWGGRSAIGYAQATCRIKKLSRQGATFTITDVCTDIASGSAIEGGPTRLVIASPTAFRMNDTNYRYCGPKPVW